MISVHISTNVEKYIQDVKQTGKSKTVQIKNVKSSPANRRDDEPMHTEMDVDDDGCLQNLTDMDLRRVFKGLVSSGK